MKYTIQSSLQKFGACFCG